MYKLKKTTAVTVVLKINLWLQKKEAKKL